MSESIPEVVAALAPTGSSGSGGAAFWAGPWEVEGVDGLHGPMWAVVRRGEPVAEGGQASTVDGRGGS